MTGSSELSSPLLDIVRRAAAATPKSVVEETRQKDHERRLVRAQRIQGSDKGVRVLVLDTSGSMMSLVAGEPKHEHLKRAVVDVLRTWPGIKIVAFASSAAFVGVNEIPMPSSSTALDVALALAATIKPERTVVVSDGQPDSAKEALRVARGMTGVIDVVYCGNDGDAMAIGFMRELAESTGGQEVEWQAGQLSLEAEIRGMLMLEG